MSDEEVRFMTQFKVGELQVDAGTTLMNEGSSSPQLYTALDGMGLRYKTLASGDRQVINFVIPGDFIGLQAGVMNEMQHSVEATTDMTLCVFDRKSFWLLFRDNPKRAFDITWIAAIEEHFLGETLAVLGHLSGIERIARAFIRLHDRMKGLDLIDNGRILLPYRQQDLADALGLSLVHTNKTLKRLRDRGVLEWRDGFLTILSYAELCSIADVDIDGEPLRRPLM
jgi:CRP/FNR family transcriptional regulator